MCRERLCRVDDIIKPLRIRAELARHLSRETKDSRASQSLREIAEGLDLEADTEEANRVVSIETGAPPMPRE